MMKDLSCRLFIQCFSCFFLLSHPLAFGQIRQDHQAQRQSCIPYTLKQVASFNHALRLIYAETLLQRSLTYQQKHSILQAHAYGMGEMGKNGQPAEIGNYTLIQIRHKTALLKDGGFSKAERRALLETGIVGGWYTGANNISNGMSCPPGCGVDRTRDMCIGNSYNQSRLSGQMIPGKNPVPCGVTYYTYDDQIIHVRPTEIPHTRLNTPMIIHATCGNDHTNTSGIGTNMTLIPDAMLNGNNLCMGGSTHKPHQPSIGGLIASVQASQRQRRRRQAANKYIPNIVPTNATIDPMPHHDPLPSINWNNNGFPTHNNTPTMGMAGNLQWVWLAIMDVI